MKSYLLAAAATLVAVSAALVVDTPAQAQAPGNCYLGEIIAFPFTFCPKGWLPTDGQTVLIVQNQALFALLGVTYGGDGKTNFKLPHLKPIHSESGAPVLQCIATQGVFPARN